MNRCESHSQIIANLIQERDYYMQLLTSWYKYNIFIIYEDHSLSFDAL